MKKKIGSTSHIQFDQNRFLTLSFRCKINLYCKCIQQYRYLTNDDTTCPLVLYGPPGSGKTTVMASVAKHSHLWNQDVVVVARFANASAYSWSLEQTLNSAVVQLELVDSGKSTWFKHVSFIFKCSACLFVFHFYTRVFFFVRT